MTSNNVEHPSPLLKALETFPAGSIYTLASKSVVLEGFTLYGMEKVRNLRWGEGNRSLLFELHDGFTCHVTFRFQEDELRFACDCSKGLETRPCPHIICALLTIKNLLNPSLFRNPKENPKRRNRLLTTLQPSLSSEKPLEDLQRVQTARGLGYAIVLQKVRDELIPYITLDGKRIEPSPHPTKHPVALAPFTRFGIWMIRKEQLLAAYLLEHGNLYPLIFKSEENETFVRWDESANPTTWTEINLSGGEIKVSKRAALDKKGGDCVLVDRFVFDLNHHTFSLIRNDDGWFLWYVLRERLGRHTTRLAEIRLSEESQTSFSLPLRVFEGDENLVLRAPRKTLIRSTRFRVEGKEAFEDDPGPSELFLEITKLEEEGGYLLKPKERTGPLERSLCRAPFDFALAVNRRSLYPPLRTRRAREVLYQAFFSALSQPTDPDEEEVLRKTIPVGIFPDYRSMRDSRKIVREHLKRYPREGTELILRNDRWFLISHDRRREHLLFTIPYEVFGPSLFDRGAKSGHGMIVSEEAFSKSLSTLYERCHEQGIELVLNDQPIRKAAWEFSVDTTRTAIDWFEVHPEIRCNGEAVDEALWERAILQKGLVERNGFLELLDPESIEKLRALAERMSRVGESRDGKTIVKIPRLHILDWIALRKKGIEVKLSAEEERVFERLTRFEGIEERAIPKGLRVSLRPYQREGYAWLAFLYENRFGACLADDMGLGKTVQALSLLAGIKEGLVHSWSRAKLPHLVVLPPSLVFNWEREVERFYPGFEVYTYLGKERCLDFGEKEIILTTYGVVRRDIERLKEIRFDVIVFDEAQTIKNIYAHTTGAVRQLQAFFKVALTGTPVENHIGEYYSIMDLVLPGLLGEYDLFRNKSRREDPALLEMTITRTKPFVLRRTKETTLKELPPKIETDFYLDLTERQKAFYNRTVEAVKTTIDEAYRTKTTSQARIIALTALLKLRQICLSPQLLIPEEEEVSPKIEFLKVRLRKLFDEGHHALIFSQFTSFLDIVEKEIEESGYRLLRLDGSTPGATRKKRVESFQQSDHPTAFLLSLKAGGQGLNLTKATYVFHLDPWWNPAVESQASDRAHRIGQRNTVIITRILMKHTIEEKMMELKKRKLKLYQALLETPLQGGHVPITREDFEFLLSGV
jgi:superfamily II DNA or RNA helicase